MPFEKEAAACRAAQREWMLRPVRDRLRPVRAFRHLLVERANDITAAVEADVGRPPGEVTATDLLPTAAAAKFLEKQAERVLAPRRVGGRPLWLIGCRDAVHRRPHGVVGLIGTWNYPVFLTAVPVLHALVAGNGVLVKPSEHASRSAAVLHELYAAAGFPPGLVQLLPATRDAGPQLADADIDFLHFTGSDAVGRKLAARLGERLIPSALELSGCDAAIVFADAAVELAARCVWYGTTLNGGQTCMAVRRAIVQRAVYERFVEALTPLASAARTVRLLTPGQAERMRDLVTDARAQGGSIGESPPVATGGLSPTLILDASPQMAAWKSAAFAPLLAVAAFDAPADALALHAASPYRLTAAVFGRDIPPDFVAQLPVGSVTVNDVIVPTAHPGTPFGGRAASGWGVTQGAEGLLQMTVPQAVSVRAGQFRPHVDALLSDDPAAADVAAGALKLAHARRWRDRLAGLRQMVGGMRRTGKAGG